MKMEELLEDRLRNNPKISLPELFEFIEDMCADKVEKAKAYVILGMKFDPLISGGENGDMACECYEKADKLGCADASTLIGVLYETGELGYHQRCKCVEWYTKAFGHGNSYAMLRLGDYYSYLGDIEKAEECFLNALTNKDNRALMGLGYLYEKKGDYKKAVEYLSKYVEFKKETFSQYSNVEGILLDINRLREMQKDRTM